MSRRTRLNAVAILGICLLVAGCGRPSRTVPAGGVVTLDGEPLVGAAVLFSPVAGGVPGRGTTGADGTFTLTTFDTGDGALVGIHRIGVSKIETKGFTTDADGVSGKLDGRRIVVRSLMPERYMSPASSGLEATVERRGKNRFSLQLSSSTAPP